jgi:parallel beta-helix repeat protein
VISGSIEIETWVAAGKNIWLAECPACQTEPGNLFLDNTVQPLGRYPNSGYRTLQCPSVCQSALSDNSLNFANGYWDNAEVVARSSRWTLDNLPVFSYQNKTFNFLMPASYPLLGGFGYFVQKHLSTLDKNGEWFFDKSAKKVYLYLDPGLTPQGHSIRISLTDLGLNMTNANNIILENLSFKYQRLVGARIKNCNNVLFQNNDIAYSGNNGLEVIACENPSLKNNVIADSNNNGVEWRDNIHGAFSHNSIKRTGLRAGRGMSGNGTYIGLIITANNPLLGDNLFQYNTVDSTGYLGIDFRTGHTHIKNNLISNFCMIKDDGAGIYTWNNTYGDNRIEGNIILHGIGSGAGTANPDQLYVSGIYIDDRSRDLLINNNTAAYCPTTGIYLHNAKQLTLAGNTLFGNGNPIANRENAQLLIKLDAIVPLAGNTALDLHITGNTVIAQEGSHCVFLSAEKEQDLNLPGSFDRNQYGAPRVDQVIAKFYPQPDLCSALEELQLGEWQRMTGYDKGSVFKLIHSQRAEPVGENMIGNSRMTNSTNGWMTWPAQLSIVHDKKQGIDGPSLNVQFPPGHTEGLLYYAGINLNRNKRYRLSFSARSSKQSKLEFVPLMAVAPWESLGDYTCFSVDTDYKTFTCFFKPHKSQKEARVNFKCNTPFWIDNVTLYEVTSSLETGGESEKLICNPIENPQAISVPGKWVDLDGNPVSDQVRLPGYGSMILLKRP